VRALLYLPPVLSTDIVKPVCQFELIWQHAVSSQTRSNAHAHALNHPAGAYNPTLKLIYGEENPLSASTLTAVRTVLSAAALLAAVAIQGWSGGQPGTASDSAPNAAEVCDPIWSQGSGALLMDPNRQGWLAYSFVGILPAGIELGLYNFSGTASQAMGLQLTSATRASFLVQLTAVLVPLLSFLSGERISPRTWTAVAIGLAGSLLVAYDGVTQRAGSGLAGSSAEELKGMALIILSVCSYSLATVRLGIYGKKLLLINLLGPAPTHYSVLPSPIPNVEQQQQHCTASHIANARSLFAWLLRPMRAFCECFLIVVPLIVTLLLEIPLNTFTHLCGWNARDVRAG